MSELSTLVYIVVLSLTDELKPSIRESILNNFQSVGFTVLGEFVFSLQTDKPQEVFLNIDKGLSLCGMDSKTMRPITVYKSDAPVSLSP